MNMFFTSISKFCSSCYLSAAFHLNIGRFNAGLLVLGIAYTDLVVFTGISTSLIATIGALAASVAV